MMEHSKDFYNIKNWYEHHIYTKKMVEQMWKKGRITEAEYKEIVGED